MLGSVLSLLVLILLFLYYYIKKSYGYWEKRGIPCKEPTILLGNIADLVLRKKSFFDVSIDLYNQFPDKRYNGFYQLLKPVVLIRDIELIKKIAIKDFDHFMDHVTFGGGEGDKIITKALFNLKGQDWHEMRCTLSPAFTSSKMKNMFLFMQECVDKFTDYLEETKEPVITYEVKTLFSKFTNDVIASTAFGVVCNTFKQPENEFFTMGTHATSYFKGFQVILSQLWPRLYKLLKLRLFPKEVVNFFETLVKDNIEQRERKNIYRPDMIHLLMEARKGKLKHESIRAEIGDSGFATAEESELGSLDCQKKTITNDEMVGQVMLFFFAGFDAVSLASSFMAYELALNPDVQKKLQDEIHLTLGQCNGKLTYEKLLGMKYMDQVVSETLRKWPPGFRLDRVCVRDYVIPAENEGETPLLIERGQVINLPVAGIHRDPKYYPDPMKFNPERFNDENKATIVPGSYMPFGAGPRNCIGSRFALLEMKVLFFYLLLKFDITPVRQTQIPLKLCTKQFNPAPAKGCWLGLERTRRRNDS